eukprot:Nitzschia sp. Nitz4//scaffold3_size479765//254109//256481//NITZ4_000106-RA/size479765-processed-gene-1.515-mRNA-1//-1//CDS//3329550776//2596//frame0
MYSHKKLLEAASKHRGHIALVVGTVVPTAAIVASLPDEESHGDPQGKHRPCQLPVYNPSDFSLFVPNFTSCDFFPGSSLWNLRKVRTERCLEDLKSKESLRDKYKVRWRKPLGRGGFGDVYYASDRKTKETFAVKKIEKEFTSDESFQREVNSLIHIRQKGGHPNICGLKEHFVQDECFYLVLDLVEGGEMFDRLINNGAYSEADAARLMREVGSALAFLHGIDVVHGDMKPENLMLSSENPLSAVIKLVDFGTAEVTDSTSPFYQERTDPRPHTPGYSPPEVIDPNRNESAFAPPVDMFAVGVILFVMLCGAHPFDLQGRSTNAEMNEKVLAKKNHKIGKTPHTKHLSDSAIDIIEKLMHPDPRKRLTAQQMLNHPWIRGETARTGKIVGSAERLSSLRKYKSTLEAKVFQSMIEFSRDHGVDPSDIPRKTSLIEQSFQLLDSNNKGYISTSELNRLMTEDAEVAPADEDETQVGLSDFSELLSENMKNRFFPAGHVVYHEGERGKKMYFINSGRIEVSTKNGFTSTVGQGDFFGEGALLSKDGKRSATIKCITPVHAIEISQEYFHKYLVNGYDTHLSLHERNWSRRRGRAKAILGSAKNMKEEAYVGGEYFYQEDEAGDNLYILESGEVAIYVDEHIVSTKTAGEFFGEHAMIFGKPRNAAAKCISDKCLVQIMKASDFHKIMNSSSVLQETLQDISLRGEFQKAVVFATKKDFPTDLDGLKKVFQEIDIDGSGSIDRLDLTFMLKSMDKSFTQKDIKDIMDTIDLDGTGTVTWEEFKRLFEMPTSS